MTFDEDLAPVPDIEAERDKHDIVTFELEPGDRQTYVNFSHYNWQQADAFLAHCSTKWGVFMLSLKSCIETGKGRPFPDDIHIDFDE